MSSHEPKHDKDYVNAFKKNINGDKDELHCLKLNWKCNSTFFD